MKTKLLFIVLFAGQAAISQTRFHQINETQKDLSFLKKQHAAASNKKTTPVIQPQSLIYLDDSIYDWQWDTLAMTWNIFEKDIQIVYDSHQNPVSDLVQTWNGYTWDNLSQFTYTYNANDNMTNFLVKNWNGTGWDNSNQTTYTYDVNNNQINEIDQNWNGTSWDNSYLYINTYNANNDETSQLEQTWNGTGWDNAYLYTNTYNTYNKITSQLEQSWNGTAWVNSYQTNYIYNAFNIITSLLSQQWNGTGWDNSYQHTCSYDVFNNLIKDLGKTWNGTGWVNFYQFTYTYDANNFMKSSVGKEFDKAGIKAINGDSSYFYFHLASGINELNNSSNISIFPNPFSYYITLQSDKIFKDATLTVYNSFGQEVKHLKNISGQSFTLQRSDLPSGVYFIRLTQDNLPDGQAGKIISTDKLMIIDK